MSVYTHVFAEVSVFILFSKPSYRLEKNQIVTLWNAQNKMASLATDPTVYMVDIT